MKKALYVFLTVIFGASLSWALPRQLQCKLTKLKKVDVFLDQELNLAKNPWLQYSDSRSHWILKIGDLELNTRNAGGQVLRKRSVKLMGSVREYSFWVDSKLQFQFELDETQQTVNLYWWGTGRRNLLANFACQADALR